MISDQIRSVAQSCPTLCNPMNRSTPGLLSITNSRSSLRLTSIESVMPSSHLLLCRPLLLLPPIPPSIRIFSNESTALSHHHFSGFGILFISNLSVYAFLEEYLTTSVRKQSIHLNDKLV